MSTTNPSQLFLLADHIKLSLLERQRAASLNLPPNSQDGQISRSLDALRAGIEAIEAQLSDSPDADLSAQTTRLRSQHTELSTQFSANSASASPTLTQPNDPSLARDFRAATSKPSSAARNKSVRFTDSPRARSPPSPARAALFPYRDDPSPDADAASRAPPDQAALSNEQIHAYHGAVLRQQDAQLDALGASIGRQRELSLQIGDELEGQMLLLDEVDEGVDRHQGRLDRARGRLGVVARRARENWSLSVIVVLIVVLVLLIAVLK